MNKKSMRIAVLSAAMAGMLTGMPLTYASNTLPPGAQPVAEKAGFFESIGAKIKAMFPQYFQDRDTSTAPAETLRAPFADPSLPPVAPTPLMQFGIGVSELDKTAGKNLDVPHRNQDELAKWLDRAVAETMSFSPASYPDHIKHLATGFTPEGLAQFQAWVQNANLIQAMETGHLQMNGFVQEAPFLLNEGVVNGRYRWLFEIPVMISFFDKDVKFMKSSTQIKETRRLLVRLQIGRVATGGLENGVLIETWEVYANTRKN